MGNYYRNNYHSHFPPWRRGFSKVGNYFGLELEVEPMESDHREILSAMPDVPSNYSPVTESDGSLSSQGVEIIFPPMTLATYKRPNSHFRKILESLKPVTFVSHRCGLHISVNRNGWTDRQAAQFVAVIHNLPTPWLSRIGGRPPNSYCRQLPQQGLLNYLNVGGHSYAAEIGRSRIECRFPAATTDHTRIVNLLQFLTAIQQFVFIDQAVWATCGGGGYQDILREFVLFLNKSKQRRKLLRIMHYGYTEEDSEDSSTAT